MSDISDEDWKVAERAFDDEHDLWDFKREQQRGGGYVVTRGTEVMATAFDDLVAENEMHEMRDVACLRAAIEALQALGWRKIEKIKTTGAEGLSLGEGLYGRDSKPFPRASARKIRALKSTPAREGD